ncbi:unnamed protein product [Closterium sp. NIES-65]|nr:unnamed protein product [Closterium sp. NIES-65]
MLVPREVHIVNRCEPIKLSLIERANPERGARVELAFWRDGHGGEGEGGEGKVGRGKVGRRRSRRCPSPRRTMRRCQVRWTRGVRGGEGEVGRGEVVGGGRSGEGEVVGGGRSGEKGRWEGRAQWGRWRLPRAPRGERGAKLRCCAEIEAQRAALPVVAGEGEGVEAAGSSSAVCGETGSGKQSVSKKFRRCCGVGERAGVRGVGERAGVRGVGERAGACGVGERAGVRGVGKGQVLGTVSALTGLELWELDKRLAKLKRPGWTRVGLSSYS